MVEKKLCPRPHDSYVMAEPKRAGMKLTPDLDSATPKTNSTQSETSSYLGIFATLKLTWATPVYENL
ncbi:hypothetical protein NQ318_005090 [Aromia moschata]|uniref:Uncharacterized protein n=1 Tax=Aromia moschata TaxID=1265417 RepID=A0AAV8YDX7_9CUCU|nr:hypothetical protein NQ318_005090 [Aromia moschata]